MATYQELSSIRDDSQWNGLLSKVRIACAIKAGLVIDSAAPGATVLAWAKDAVANPNQAGDRIVFYVVASNAGAVISAIYGASDSAIQNNVNDAVDAIYGA